MLKSYSYRFDVIDKVTAPVKKMAGAFGFSNLKLQTFSSGIQRKGKVLSSFGTKLLSVKNLLIGSFVTTGIARLGSELTGTLAKFEKFEAILTTTLGSTSAARQVLDDITKFASQTPFQIDELTDSWVRMANQGFKPNIKQMTQLGDLASSTGKDFTQLAEAILDAKTFEFERLKEFGIKASKAGDKITFTFKGVKTQVDATDGAIQNYLLGLGKVTGVQGSMAGIMEHTGGKISNFHDKVTQLKLNLATGLKPVINGVIDVASRFVSKLIVLVEWIKENRVQVLAWTKVIGGIVGGFFAIWGAAKLMVGINAMVMTVKTGFLLFSKALNVAKIAQFAFNLVASLNPIGVIITVVGLAIAAFVAFSDKLGGVRELLANMGRWILKNNPFSFLIKFIDIVIPGFSASMSGMLDTIKTAFKTAFKWIMDTVLWPFRQVFEKIFGFKLEKGVKSSPTGKRGRLGGSVGDTRTIDPYAAVLPSGGTGSAGGKGKGLGVDKGLKSAVSGGGNIKQITIQIDKIVEGGINIYSQTVGMGAQQMKSELSRILLDVVNDVNYQ